MADDTAHIAPGPQSDPVGVDAKDTPPELAVAAGDTTAEPMTPSFAEYTETIGAGIELIGHSADPAAGARQDVPVAVLVGAASTHGDQHSSGAAVVGAGTEDPPPRQGSSSLTRGDEPFWSFRDSGPRSVTLPAPPDRAQVELPFAHVEEPPAPPPAREPTFGPIGQARSGLLVALLAVTSLGVYALVWHRRINRELEEFDPKLHARPGRSTAAVTIPWLTGLLITLAGAALVVTARLSVHIPFDTHLTGTQAYYLLAGLAAVPYLTLLLPFSLLAVVMTLERIRCVEEHLGTTTDRQVRPVATALLLAIPIVGGLILLSAEQRRINALWEKVAPAGFVSR